MSPRRGCGLFSALSVLWWRPATLDSCCVNIARAICSASSSRSKRSRSGGNGIPYATCSSSFHAAPRPSTARPREMMSSVVVSFASSAGLRYVTPPTSRPRLTRDVRAASAPRIVLPSSIQFVGGPTPRIWCRWSITVTELKPDSSAVPAISTRCSNSCSGAMPG